MTIILPHLQDVETKHLYGNSASRSGPIRSLTMNPGRVPIILPLSQINRNNLFFSPDGDMVLFSFIVKMKKATGIFHFILIVCLAQNLPRIWQKKLVEYSGPKKSGDSGKNITKTATFQHYSPVVAVFGRHLLTN